MDKLNKIDTLLASLLGGISFLFIILLLFDINYAYQDPKTYEMVHHMSISNYVHESLSRIPFLVLLVLISLMTLIDKKRVRYWKPALYISVALSISIIVYSYISWASTGFDH